MAIQFIVKTADKEDSDHIKNLFHRALVGTEGYDKVTEIGIIQNGDNEFFLMVGKEAEDPKDDCSITIDLVRDKSNDQLEGQQTIEEDDNIEIIEG